jgi:hypothetical protein
VVTYESHSGSNTFINLGTLTSESEWKAGALQLNVKGAKGAYADVLEKTDTAVISLYGDCLYGNLYVMTIYNI